MVPLGKELNVTIFHVNSSILKGLFKKHHGKMDYGLKFGKLSKD